MLTRALGRRTALTSLAGRRLRFRVLRGEGVRRGRDLTLASATFRAVVATIIGLDAFKATTAWKAAATRALLPLTTTGQKERPD